MVKLGKGRKEHQEQALKQIKELSEEAKISVRQHRSGIQDTLKKLRKILPQDYMHNFEGELTQLIKDAEA